MHLPHRSRGSRRVSSKMISTINVGLPYGPLVGTGVHTGDRVVRLGNQPDLQQQQAQHSMVQQGQYRSRVLSPSEREFRDRPLSGDVCFVPVSQEHLPFPEGLPPAPRRAYSQSSYGTKIAPYNHQGHKATHESLQHHDSVNGPMSAGLTMGHIDPGLSHGKHRRHLSETQPVITSPQLPASHVFLPGDRVIFTESASAPGIPIVYRLGDEKHANPDKLNLDRRNLTVCPVLEGEDTLRLLNYQHNLITRIQHVSNLRKLIFLDLYDNQIQEISGLNALKSLRVLMLGKNRIQKINNLNELAKLDVLDLHGNKISKIENLSHLCELRVLNLAGNDLVTVQNITGLDSLAELNLRRNKICTVMEIGNLPCLQRLFLSYNEIKKFDDISCLSRSLSLTEVSLDGNPFCTHSHYKQILLQNIKNIRQLDMKRISDEEKRIANVMARKEEERKRESDKAASLKEKRRLAILNAQRQWELQYDDKERDTGTTGESALLTRTQSHSSIKSDSSSSKLSVENTDYSVCHLAELDGEELNLYGPGALDAIERNWGERTSSAVTTVKFHYILFDEIVPYLSKIRPKFPSFQKLFFMRTNLRHFRQLNALAILNHLEVLYVSEEGNPVTSFTLWKPYILFRLSHLSLQTINGCQVSTEDIVHAEKLFGPLGHITTTHLSQSRLLVLLGHKRKTDNLQDHPEKQSSKKAESKDSRMSSAESVSRAGLTYSPVSGAKEDKDAYRRKFAKDYVNELIQTASLSDRKRAAFEKMWPKLFSEMVTKAVHDMTDVNSYMKESLEKIKRS